jgi:TolB-like protein
LFGDLRVGAVSAAATREGDIMAPPKLVRTLALVGCASLLSLTACAGASMERVDPRGDDEVGGTLIDSADVIAATEAASEDLAGVLLASSRNDLVLAFATIKNESIQPFNTALLTDRMRNTLVRRTSPRVKYLAREQIDEILREREGKRTGVYAGKELKSLLGADYLLTGRINSLSKRYEGDRADYFQLNFQLVDAEDSTIVWTDAYEFKKVGDAGVIYQ